MSFYTALNESPYAVEHWFLRAKAVAEAIDDAIMEDKIATAMMLSEILKEMFDDKKSVDESEEKDYD